MPVKYIKYILFLHIIGPNIFHQSHEQTVLFLSFQPKPLKSFYTLAHTEVTDNMFTHCLCGKDG